MGHDFFGIEQKWQKYWREKQTFKVSEDAKRPKFYVLDMFPYPSGAGLHVGHPLGYIASDIYARYKRLCGYNVLHPMGYDAFGLPAEQYAIQTGQHPAVTTQNNIERYRKQMDLIGFSYDWDREVRTCDADYYHWTQWAFIKMFQSYYDLKENKALPIEQLVKTFEREGNAGVAAAHSTVDAFSAEEWKSFDSLKRDEILGAYRIAYLADMPVNWCPALGTVLANDEVKDGLSVRGGHPVVQKNMKQWSLRVSAYAQRLLDGLDKLDWSESIKTVQRSWIGRSEGAEINFSVIGSNSVLPIYTTRPDTIFGVTFMVLAPESDFVEKLVTSERAEEVREYVEKCRSKTRREREIETEKVSGVFIGAYVSHPFTDEKVPVWVGDYVLGGYGTGAIMAVPAHDSRDYAFATYFKIPIVPVIADECGEGAADSARERVKVESYDLKDGYCINSDFLNGMRVSDAISKVCAEVERCDLGSAKVNFRLRDAIFSRQRYWGEPFPVYYKDGIPDTLSESELPLKLPEIDAYLPTEEGEPPLARAKNWKDKDGHPLELSTMPGFAGSSAYFLRYMDPHNREQLCSKSANQYWRNVDLYLGGNEHATGHLIYSRFWNKFLYDLGLVCEDEPFKKLINQGMIQGRSNFVYRLKDKKDTYVSCGLKDKYDVQQLHVDVNIVENDILDLKAFKSWREEFADAEFILEREGGREVYRCGHAVEKMSKSLYNVVNPDSVIEKYGADTLRLYEMFLGPIEQSKPWSTGGIEGVHRFLTKFWNLFFDGEKLSLSDETPSDDELKVLHTCIKKVSEDMESFSFNTSVAAFMIATNDLSGLKCNKREILLPLTVLLSPFAPHISEELHQLMGFNESIIYVRWPKLDETYLREDTFKCPVSFNGKTRFVVDIPKFWAGEEVEEFILKHERSQTYLEGKRVVKVIVVPGKICNIVLS